MDRFDPLMQNVKIATNTGDDENSDSEEFLDTNKTDPLLPDK